MTKDYHRIEKGLAFASPKRPFGADAKSRLEFAMSSPGWRTSNGYSQYVVDALDALNDWNKEGRISDIASIEAKHLGRVRLTESDAQSFFTTRRSVRAFQPERVPPTTDIAKAVELAINTPSVCNRQAWRAHYYVGSDARRVLSHQKGNRGFGDTIPAVIVVTVDAQLFSGSGERNQRWVDGGLFAMTLVWALHAINLSTCMLNWSRSNQDSDALRHAAGIPPSEDVVVLIAVGYPVDGHRVARSARRGVAEVLVEHSSEKEPGVAR